MKHVATKSGPGQLGGGQCACGKGFATLKMAEDHATEQNLIEKNEAKAAAAKAEVENQAELTAPTTPQEPAEAPKTDEPAPKSEKAPAATTKAEKPAETPAAPTQSFGDLSPLQQTQTLVKKYATSLLDDKRAAAFAATVALLARKNPQLANATQESFLTAVMACVHLDLMPNTPEGYAYIIPYKNYRTGIVEAQFQLGYRGTQELAYRTGNVLKMRAELVFAEDEFDVEYAPEERITHKPKLDIDRTKFDKVQYAYAVAKLANGETQFVVMTRSEIDKVRNSAKASSTDAPWNTWATEMVRKTVIKRLTKTLPASTTDNRLKVAAEFDSLAEAGKLAYIEGELVERPKNALPSGVQAQIDEAATVEDLQRVVRALPVADQKKAAEAVMTRLKEVA